jgi:outer membrane biosynthesis protein TonB
MDAQAIKEVLDLQMLLVNHNLTEAVTPDTLSALIDWKHANGHTPEPRPAPEPEPEPEPAKTRKPSSTRSKRRAAPEPEPEPDDPDF